MTPEHTPNNNKGLTEFKWFVPRREVGNCRSLNGVSPIPAPHPYVVDCSSGQAHWEPDFGRKGSGHEGRWLLWPTKEKWADPVPEEYLSLSPFVKRKKEGGVLVYTFWKPIELRHLALTRGPLGCELHQVMDKNGLFAKGWYGEREDVWRRELGRVAMLHELIAILYPGTGRRITRGHGDEPVETALERFFDMDVIQFRKAPTRTVKIPDTIEGMKGAAWFDKNRGVSEVPATSVKFKVREHRDGSPELAFNGLIIRPKPSGVVTGRAENDTARKVVEKLIRTANRHPSIVEVAEGFIETLLNRGLDGNCGIRVQTATSRSVSFAPSSLLGYMYAALSVMWIGGGPNLRVCQIEGCENPVPRGRLKYCRDHDADTAYDQKNADSLRAKARLRMRELRAERSASNSSSPS